ncbi:MAG: formylglycine-generating enzyme family protein [Anaerolineae bacterium]|nr:formylglycine-generating enzyme family protein [Anaerolineae bacterium]
MQAEQRLRLGVLGGAGLLLLIMLAGCQQAPAFIAADTRNADWTPQYADFAGLPMVRVPAGCFIMGRNDGPTEESPARRVCLTTFWIGQTEVTNAQYAACVEAEACTLPADPALFDNPALADHPVVNVTWEQAAAYAAWRGGTLPTEAQWEYAARGPQGYPYPWGFAEPDCRRVNYADCAGQTLAVGPDQRPEGASWVGALDMGGNVWEWTSDWFGARSYVDYDDGEIDPKGPGEGQLRVLRGGAWGEAADRLRATYRARHTPNAWNPARGFRIVIVGEPPPPTRSAG